MSRELFLSLLAKAADKRGPSARMLAKTLQADLLSDPAFQDLPTPDAAFDASVLKMVDAARQKVRD